jgi:demethylmenaquinone methyltransferase/2-methoxy-6-polyprenyl-1,4-benzoquinol methylase
MIKHGWRRKAFWLADQHRKKQFEGGGNRKTSVYFGYQLIPSEEKEQRVLEHFNSIARYYDLMNNVLSFGIHHLWKRTAVKMLAPAPGDRVLDVCSGTGDLAILAARTMGNSGRVIVYDINRSMIEAGLHKVISTPLKKQINYVQGDAEGISFSDLCFDGAMVGFGIRNVTDLEKGFSEMYRVLKPGGKMICLEFSRPTATMFRWLYDFYSFSIIPQFGAIIAGSRKAYTHLSESIRVFPLADELSAILVRTGFSAVSYQRLTNGIAVIHVAVK